MKWLYMIYPFQCYKSVPVLNSLSIIEKYYCKLISCPVNWRSFAKLAKKNSKFAVIFCLRWNVFQLDLCYCIDSIYWTQPRLTTGPDQPGHRCLTLERAFSGKEIRTELEFSWGDEVLRVTSYNTILYYVCHGVTKCHVVDPFS